VAAPIPALAPVIKAILVIILLNVEAPYVLILIQNIN
jgi:hypothetical protein